MASNLPDRSIGRTPVEHKANVRKYSQRTVVDIAIALVAGVANIFVGGLVGIILGIVVIVGIVDAVFSAMKVRKIINYED